LLGTVDFGGDSVKRLDSAKTEVIFLGLARICSQKHSQDYFGSRNQFLWDETRGFIRLTSFTEESMNGNRFGTGQ